MASYGTVWRTRFEMIRPGNAAMAAVGALIGAALTAPIAAVVVIPAMLAAAFITAFGNVLNDLHDHELDGRAHPERPLPSGRMNRSSAQTFAVLLLGFGLLEAYAAEARLLLFAAINAAVLYAYEWWLKRRGWPGNLAVGALVASTFVFGAYAMEPDWRAWGLVPALAVMAFLSTVARELWKDIQDADGDRGSRTTLPMQLGAMATHWLAAFFLVVAVGLSAWTWSVQPGAWGIVLALAAVAFLAAVGTGHLDARRAQQLTKTGMLLALAAFALSTA